MVSQKSRVNLFDQSVENDSKINMSDRENILRRLKQNRPAETALPLIDFQHKEAAELIDQFVQVTEEVGGKAIELSGREVNEVLNSIFDALEPAYPEEIAGKDDLSALQLFVCTGSLGVAENGAIWVPESSISQRVAPFITQHLVIVLDKTQIVSDMHAAYSRLDIASPGFGVFVAGPSKTADIEQSLVLGAHGPRSLTVLLQ